jgi:hypothetical protein
MNTPDDPVEMVVLNDGGLNEKHGRTSAQGVIRHTR